MSWNAEPNQSEWFQVYEWIKWFIKKNQLKKKIHSPIQFSHWFLKLILYWLEFTEENCQWLIYLGFRRPPLSFFRVIFLELNKYRHYEMWSEMDSLHEALTALSVIPFAHLTTSWMELLHTSLWTRGQKSH